MITSLFIGLLAAFGLMYIYIGKKAAAQTEDNESYFLSGRNLGFFSLTLTLLATQLGGGTLMGASEEAYSKGWVVLFYPGGICLGFIVLALGVGKKLRESGLTTVAELFERAYGSALLRRVVSLISIATMFFVLVGMGVAVRKFFGAVGYESIWLYLAFWLVVILYTVMGGLKAVVNTDIVQMVFVLIVLSVVTASVWLSGGSQLAIANAANVALPVSSEPVPWVAWLLMPLLFMVFEQDMAQRCFASKSPKAFSIAGILAAVLLFASSLFSVYFGVLARKLGIVAEANQGVLMTAIMQLTSPAVATFFAVAILLVIISTADSLLCSVASNLAFDFPFLKGASEKKKVVLSQGITFVVGIVAMICSYFFNNIVALLIQSYEFSVCVLFVPVIMTLFVKRSTLKASIASMTMGALGFIAFRLWECPIPKEVATLALSFFGFVLAQTVIPERIAKAA